MGLFDFFRRKKKNETKEEYINNTNYSPSLKLPHYVRLSNGEYIELKSINDEVTISHSDGRKTIVKVAAISDIYKDGEANILTPRKFIVFEVQEGQIIDEKFIYDMMSKYLNQKNAEKKGQIIVNEQEKNSNCTYIGEYNNYTSEFKRNSFFSEQYVSKIIMPKYDRLINTQNAEIKNDNDMRENDLRKRNILPPKKTNNRLNEIIKSRILNPYFVDKGKRIENGQILYNYNGINLNNGNILKIRNLKKVGKDRNGTYLYAGYLQSVFKEEAAEKLSGEPLGAYICFETKKRVEDIVKDQDPKEIMQLLFLLTLKNQMEYQNNGELNFIGSIDENGYFMRFSTPVSNTIRNTVIKMQNDYLEFKRNEGMQR